MSHDVFISYSSKDQQIADGVCAALESNGITYWIATRNISPGEEYPEAILTDGIDPARLVVLIFSSHANKSKDVETEVSYAFQHDKPIIPFRIEDVPRSRNLEYYLRTPQWLDALTSPKEKYFPILVKSIRRLLEKSPAPTRTTATAPPPTSVEKIVGSIPSAQPTVTAPSSSPAEQLEAVTSHVSMGQRSLSASNPLLRVGIIVSAIALLGLFWIFFIKPRDDDDVTNVNSKPGVTFNINRVLTRNTNTGTAAKGGTDGDAKTENANSTTVNNADTGGETSGRVLLYYSEAAKANMLKVRQALRDEKYMVLPGPLPDPAPDNSEVRYYFTVDKESAERVSDIIARTLGIKLNVNPRLRDMSAALRHSSGEIVVYLK